MRQRIFNQKRTAFDHPSKNVQALLDGQAQIMAQVKVSLGYDVFDIAERQVKPALTSVFSEAMTDLLLETLPPTQNTRISREPLPGQFDQRADAAMQCLQLLDSSSKATVKTFEVATFDRILSDEELARFASLWINPIEMRLKALDKDLDLQEESSDEGAIANFIDFSEDQLSDYLKAEGAAMGLDDLKLIQTFFKTREHRNPTHTEFKILDTYWSDHCRHTTFETQLLDPSITEGPIASTLKEVLADVKVKRTQLGRTLIPLTLMELATLFGRFRKDERVELSEEINACSVKVQVETQDGLEDWLVQFKNETHNHPTEIEPFGGASTCIGGAIRDPLSGRAYVYQALRISGCGNVQERLDETLEGKLPQRTIATRATTGNSAYGNQIGVATTYVKEIYHPAYVAKHLELGAVVGAVKQSHVSRLSPVEGDVVILLGGKTGRDGIGGATGSSQAHTGTSLLRCASEVQKGNAPEERKLQRLYRNPDFSKRIKKSNDFGAGGVSVAIGELAPGLIIDLDQIPLKYAGLNATELAISESQERMAVVVDPKDIPQIIELAHQENVEATLVATVTSSARLVMRHQGVTVCDLDRTLIDTNGVRQSVQVTMEASLNLNSADEQLTEAAILSHLSSLNVTLQKGLIEHFDASIGATTVLFPLGGKDLISPTQASVQRVSIEADRSKTVTILAHGFMPHLAELNPFLSAQGAVLQSIAKTIAVGGKIEDIFFSFQEYFPRLGQDPRKWGQVTQALLGAYQVQSVFNRPAIGGKDSMSGSFKDLDVLETLISFACTVAPESAIRIQNLAEADVDLYLVKVPRLSNGLFDVEGCLALYQDLEARIARNETLAVRVIEQSLLSSIVELCISDRLKAIIDTSEALLSPLDASFLVAARLQELPEGWVKVGISSKDVFSVNGLVLDVDALRKAYVSGLDFLYPQSMGSSNGKALLKETDVTIPTYPHDAHSEVKVVIPFFPGTNCEVDSALAFKEAGAVPILVGIRNRTAKDLDDSIASFVDTLDSSQILMLPGGFSSGDEPDGSAKFIVNFLRSPEVKDAVHRLLKRDGLILGICNGFQALIKTGLLPYGEIRDLDEHDATLTHNVIGRHLSTIAHTRLCSNASPWLSGLKPGDRFQVPLSHGEGRLSVSKALLEKWETQGQIAFQYADELGQPSMNPRANPNGSDAAIEALISPSGQILGKMGHTERVLPGLYKNIPDIHLCPILKNGVDYFKKGAHHGKD